MSKDNAKSLGLLCSKCGAWYSTDDVEVLPKIMKKIKIADEKDTMLICTDCDNGTFHIYWG